MFGQGDTVGGKYTILKRLASGGQSHVYLAQTEDGVYWTVKAVRASDAVSEDVAAKSLETEIRVLKRLEHPGLVRIVDAIVENGTVFMISEYIRGKTLEEIIRQRGGLDAQTVVDIGVQICDVLGYLHSRRHAVIYRDLKPSNLMMREDGRVALIDFGTASMQGMRSSHPDDMPLGTRGYAAPEQYDGCAGLSDATDVYALGKTMIALLTGGKPGVRIGRLRGVPLRLRQILRRCIHENAERRYASAAEVYYDLRHLNENRMLVRILAFLRIMACAVAGACGAGCFLLYHRYQLNTLIHGAALCALTMVLWSMLDVTGAIPDLLGLSPALSVSRAKRSARVNGVFRIGRHMPTKQAISWKDIEIPLDEATTDVRMERNGTGVNVVAMKGFRIERDVMVTMRENYSV